MSDHDHIPALLHEASTDALLQQAQARAARRLIEFDGEVFPSDGCAITLSVLLQDAGIDVPDTFTAIKLGHLIEANRGWSRIPVGEQQAGDIGSTCGSIPHHGTDHIYVVLRPLNNDEMVIADNQQPHPHFRFASGKGGKSPTKFFLRSK